MPSSFGSVLIISGPSGAGKSSLIKAAKDRIGDFYFSISTTTRPPREGEKDGVDYFFVDRETFEADIKAGEFLEYAQVHGNYYGTSLKPVREALEAGKLVIFDIDVQGHAIARERMGDLITSVFVTTPSLQELERRLHGRGTDDESIIKKRIDNALVEIEYITAYDFLIVNDNFEDAVDSFIAVAKAARLKKGRKQALHFINEWRNGK
ncbi:guanylate kinase [Hydrogenimonas thermophila]|uniref:guanylate kinase n=1 Tax=Hydrogenimonas thermophila TaxID=223786 RepID=UPI00293725EF|nr:guanylate kinase [Hydrogenimonas thermophila]WOE69663.1 guanylate kinase [Hydrogenimonas thermophila]WOE72177.1 guanylate kinase [Hydrogenimonas thermophila]